MKSLFSENDIVLPEWLGILLEKVDRDTVQELLAEHEEYQTFSCKEKRITESVSSHRNIIRG